MDYYPTIQRLIQHFADHPSIASAQRHYKMEEWAAVETFAFLDSGELQWHAAGTLPYFSRHHDAEEKWPDVYARFVENGASRLHLWFEFKAIPFGTANSSRAIKNFGQDMRSLSGMNRTRTINMWNNMANPSTGKSQKAWFCKHHLPGAICEGTFAGIAILFVALRDGKSFEDIEAELTPAVEETSASIVSALPPLYGEDGLACFAYSVPMQSAL